MIRFNLYFLFFSIFFAQVSAEIIECQRLQELLPHIEEDTLVVFNINNVLTASYQDAGSTPWAEELIEQIIQEKKVTKPQATNLFIHFAKSN